MDRFKFIDIIFNESFKNELTSYLLDKLSHEDFIATILLDRDH